MVSQTGFVSVAAPTRVGASAVGADAVGSEAGHKRGHHYRGGGADSFTHSGGGRGGLTLMVFYVKSVGTNVTLVDIVGGVKFTVS
ncbi:MAG: hypothetical protein ACUVSE_09830, partial [Armatimonadota bacterium]